MLRKTLVMLLTLFLVIFSSSFLIMNFIRIGNDALGLRIIEIWLGERRESSTSSSALDINSLQLIVEQSLSLALFLFVVAVIIIKIEWRIAVAVLAISIIIFSGIVPPYNLIHKSIEWDLILFLIGSMIFAGLLREFGIFKYLAVNIIRISRNNAYTLIAMISLLAFVTAAVLDEVTSIIYIVTLIIELHSILKIDAVPLIITAVLATNTGSSALPIGNPIGVYILFSTNMSVNMFVRYSLPLAVLNIVILILMVFVVFKKYIIELRNVLTKREARLQVYMTHYYTSLNGVKKSHLNYGLLMFVLFTITILLNEHIAHLISTIARQSVDSHSLLAFIPYIFIVLCFSKIPPEDLSKYIERAVEWPSLLFFICLFILSYSLQYTGVMAKLVYVLSKLATSTNLLLPLLLIFTTILSAVLDNLSVVVTFTPITILLNNLNLASYLIYFALLYGAVFGGNYTPIGSTANIIAISLAERKRIKINWNTWLKLAFLSTTVQVLAALGWLYLQLYK
ncbi:MAG: SLC13 family permease [Sulfolobales archaeon]|nr:SLC13 family permease [Ignisphaera sp.]MCX8199742.1 SLC13 family permease [Sulfolobales archaeon]MDW8085021.1 SLC13 family permease [Ignisphaera sp.]